MFKKSLILSLTVLTISSFKIAYADSNNLNVNWQLPPNSGGVNWKIPNFPLACASEPEGCPQVCDIETGIIVTTKDLTGNVCKEKKCGLDGAAELAKKCSSDITISFAKDVFHPEGNTQPPAVLIPNTGITFSNNHDKKITIDGNLVVEADSLISTTSNYKSVRIDASGKTNALLLGGKGSFNLKNIFIEAVNKNGIALDSDVKDFDFSQINVTLGANPDANAVAVRSGGPNDSELNTPVFITHEFKADGTPTNNYMIFVVTAKDSKLSFYTAAKDSTLTKFDLQKHSPDVLQNTNEGKIEEFFPIDAKGVNVDPNKRIYVGILQGITDANRALVVTRKDGDKNRIVVDVINDAFKDSDGDNLFDNYEKLIGTDINKKDSDGDGAEDYLEAIPTNQTKDEAKKGLNLEVPVVASVGGKISWGAIDSNGDNKADVLDPAVKLSKEVAPVNTPDASNNGGSSGGGGCSMGLGTSTSSNLYNLLLALPLLMGLRRRSQK
ncbi:MAG: hypothetical protein JNK65_09805 [Deltaproteobacteria bacterium]|nr:hypothetical protein [Deltaproteobacteria bacterium]